MSILANLFSTAFPHLGKLSYDQQSMVLQAEAIKCLVFTAALAVATTGLFAWLLSRPTKDWPAVARRNRQAWRTAMAVSLAGLELVCLWETASVAQTYHLWLWAVGTTDGLALLHLVVSSTLLWLYLGSVLALAYWALSWPVADFLPQCRYAVPFKHRILHAGLQQRALPVVTPQREVAS